MSTSDDDGLGIKIGIRRGRVAIAFSQPVKWFSLAPERAEEVAKALQKFAKEIKKRRVQ